MNTEKKEIRFEIWREENDNPVENFVSRQYNKMSLKIKMRNCDIKIPVESFSLFYKDI